MRLGIALAALCSMLATPALADHWHRHGGFHRPPMGWGGGWNHPGYFRPQPRIYGYGGYGYGGYMPRYGYGAYMPGYYGYQNYGYQRYWHNYGGWGGSYSFTYCAPGQGAPLYDAYGRVTACIRSW